MNYLPETTDFVFARKLMIKGLFDPRGILGEFNDLHFLSFAAFGRFIQEGLYIAPRDGSFKSYSITVNSRDELVALLQIFTSTKLEQQIPITLHFEADLIGAVSELLTDQRIELATTPEAVRQMIDSGLELPPGISCWTKYVFTADNYAEKYEQLVKLWLANIRFNLVDLRFDYASFEAKPISELHKLFFYLNMIRIWTLRGSIQGNGSFADSGGCCNTTINGKSAGNASSCDDGACSCKDTSPQVGSQLILRARNTPVRCYVDEDLSIRLNKEEVYFPLGQYLGKTGEDLSVEDLNKIRKILDIKFPDSLISNWYLIDLDQNFKIMGDCYQVPYIADLICSWLGDQHAISLPSLVKHVSTLRAIKNLI